MKILPFLAIASLLFAFTTSCDREGAISVIDNVPEFEVVEETDAAQSLTVGDKSVTCDQVALSTFIFDGETTVNNYSLSLGSTTLSDAGVLFSAVWSPEEPETELQEGTYSDLNGSINAFTEEGLTTLTEWLDAGADPDTQPDLDDLVIFYDASGVTFTVSNITETTADVAIEGEMINEEGIATSVSGSFTATLYN